MVMLFPCCCELECAASFVERSCRASSSAVTLPLFRVAEAAPAERQRVGVAVHIGNPKFPHVLDCVFDTALRYLESLRNGRDANVARPTTLFAVVEQKLGYQTNVRDVQTVEVANHEWEAIPLAEWKSLNHATSSSANSSKRSTSCANRSRCFWDRDRV